MSFVNFISIILSRENSQLEPKTNFATSFNYFAKFAVRDET